MSYRVTSRVPYNESFAQYRLVIKDLLGDMGGGPESTVQW